MNKDRDWQHTDAAGLPEKKYKRSLEEHRSRRDDGDLNHRNSYHQHQRSGSFRDEEPIGFRGNHDHLPPRDRTWHTSYTNHHPRARRSDYESTRYRKDYDAAPHGNASGRGHGHSYGHHGASDHHEGHPYHRHQGGGHRYPGSAAPRPPEHWPQNNSRGDLNKYTKPSDEKKNALAADQERPRSPPPSTPKAHHQFENESASPLLDSSTALPARSGHVYGHQTGNDSNHHYANNSAVACDASRPANTTDINHFQALTYEKVSSILHLFDEPSQLELKKLLKSITSEHQQIEKLTREIKATRHRPSKTTDVSYNAKFAKNYYKYQEVDRNLRLIEADLAEVHQQIEALVSKTVTNAENGSHSTGLWPDSTWKLPAFHDYIKGPFVINYGDMEEDDVEVPNAQFVST